MAKKVDAQYEASHLFRVRHSTAHVMAQAVLEKFPEAKYAIGPAIDDGFYYDFDLPRPLTPNDLEEIEKRMKHIVKGNYKFEKQVLSSNEALEIFKDQPYKVELIQGLEEGGMDEHGDPLDEKPEISIYKHDKFVDLCRGPHVDSTKEINPKALKLISVAGAYWRGDEKRPMLQRIYGTVFENPEDLKDYLWRIEEAKKRDHRKVGKELDLFSINQDVGPGLILWHPNGGLIRHLVEDYCKQEHLANGYDIVYTPHIGRAHLWEVSGHLGFYNENMFASMEIEEDEYYAKPMNCPFHIMIYKNKLHSYRDFPMRMAEWGTVYRYERSGVLHGLLRVRGFTQDDAHLFCREDQIPEEIDNTLKFCLHILRHFGINEFHAYLSTRNPEKSVGEESDWLKAQDALREALERANLSYDIDEGGAAFYGPKIDLKMIDALGREWQLSTIQFDFNLPERFDMTYIGDDGLQHRPMMIHRALLGSVERFMGVLIEHYGGAFPVWLMPVQVKLIPIADRHVDFSHKVAKELKENGLRVEVDDSSERMNAKIRNAQLQKVPYMLVIGDKEVETEQVALRMRSGENPGAMSVESFLALAKNQIKELV